MTLIPVSHRLPPEDNDEPESLSYAISSVRPVSADAALRTQSSVRLSASAIGRLEQIAIRQIDEIQVVDLDDIRAEGDPEVSAGIVDRVGRPLNVGHR